MNKQLVKQKIVQFEYWNNGLSRNCEVDVKIVNIHVGKEKATADVILQEVDRVERYNNCEYPLVELGV